MVDQLGLEGFGTDDTLFDLSKIPAVFSPQELEIDQDSDSKVDPRLNGQLILSGEFDPQVQQILPGFDPCDLEG